MRREYRVREDNERFYPEWKSFWTFGDWRGFYYTRNNELEELIYPRVFKTEGEAWEFIQEKKSQPKFEQYDTGYFPKQTKK